MAFIDHEALRAIAEAQHSGLDAAVVGQADVLFNACLDDLSDPVLRHDAAAALAGYFATSAMQATGHTVEQSDLGYSFPITGIVIA